MDSHPTITVSSIDDLYRHMLTVESDIKDHLPLLNELASQCHHITELGFRTGVSTTALLAAQPDRLVSIDVDWHPNVEVLRHLKARTDFRFVNYNCVMLTIEPTDLLFIDTWHVYDQLREELRLHADKVRRWIVLHDTTAYAEKGETAGYRGLWPAVEELLAKGDWRVERRLENCAGLTVLERIAEAGATMPAGSPS